MGIPSAIAAIFETALKNLIIKVALNRDRIRFQSGPRTLRVTCAISINLDPCLHSSNDDMFPLQHSSGSSNRPDIISSLRCCTSFWNSRARLGVLLHPSFQRRLESIARVVNGTTILMDPSRSRGDDKRKCKGRKKTPPERSEASATARRPSGRRRGAVRAESPNCRK